MAFAIVAGCGRWPVARAGTNSESLGCEVFPADNIWNTRIDSLPVDRNSDAYIGTIGADKRIHPDFHSRLWEGAPIGIPYILVDSRQAKVPVKFKYSEESDPGPYPIPADMPLESNGKGDSHAILIERDTCKLYELFSAGKDADGNWHAGSGAVFDLRSNGLRREGMTSADAAGLPIFPGLVRYSEVISGQIRHALRFTAPQTRREHIWPATHDASHLNGDRYPPMGQRFRLKATVDISHYSRDAQVIMLALKQYGMFLADNGSPWFLNGSPDGRWPDRAIDDLKSLHGTDFEAVDEFSLRGDNKSGQVRKK